MIRGFTQFDIDSLTICVSICECVLLGWFSQIVTQIVRDLLTTCQIVTSYWTAEDTLFKEYHSGLKGANKWGFN